MKAAALNPARFASGASRNLNIPNGINGEKHARFRALIDRYFDPAGTVAL